MGLPGTLILFVAWRNVLQIFGSLLVIYLDSITANLRPVDYQIMTIINESSEISGVKLVHLSSFSDERGSFAEIFRKEWFPERSWTNLQSNRSVSVQGVIRGLHYHRKQVDYWYVTHGTIRVGLVDLRKSSPTTGNTLLLELSADSDMGLYIPTGIAHGFACLTRATLIYFIDNYYDGSDEYGVAWNDPDLNLDWGITNPVISDRDLANPPLKQLSPETRPG
jgi:dTDP-4-dehydrorhamnose 3,5-epimerase